ncbi:MAG: hypothetical protein WKF88_03025 [Ferruginibacter sp.]
MKYLILPFFTLISFICFGQNPLIIKTVGGADTEPGGNIINKNRLTWNGKIFYENYIDGSLVVTDGTNAGTVKIKTFDPGFGADGIYPAQDFVYVTVLKSDFVFVPPTSFIITYTRQLWRSDGTAAGTLLLKTFDASQAAVSTGVFPSNPQSNINYSISGNTMFFNGFDVTNGNELWKSDGTAAGTQLVKDIRTGTATSNARAFCKVGNTVCFSANDGTGQHLWKTDGTSAGTSIVKIINPAGGVGFECGLYKGKMYFWGNDGTNGTELWSTDGTNTGTNMVKDITPGSGSSLGTAATRGDIMFLTDDNYFYFPLNNNGPVWRTDGTEAGTIQLHPDAAGGSMAGGAYAKGNSMYWMVNTTTLYKTNGTPSSTVKVRDNLSNAVAMMVYKNAAWFNARFGITDVEPWKSDGLNANKALDIYSGSASSNPIGYFELNNYLYFFANNMAGFHFFRYDGDMTFNGSVAGGQWLNGANWNSMIPPGITDTAYIGAGLTTTISGGDAFAGTLFMNPGSSINIATDSLYIHSALSGTAATGPGILALRNFNGDTVRINSTFSASNMGVFGPVSAAGNLSITGNLNLSGDARLVMNNSNVTMTGISSTVTNLNNSYIVTNGTGSLSMENVGVGGRTGTLIYPIGTPGSFNPVNITNTGSPDILSARVAPGISNNYSGETPAGSNYSTGAVNANWFIKEAIPGGSDIAIGLQWNGSQELPGFDRSQSRMGHFVSGFWQLTGPISASGTDPFSITANGYTDFSPFGVLNNNAVVALAKINLRGYRNGSVNRCTWTHTGNSGESVTLERSVNGRSFVSVYTQAFTPSGSYDDLFAIEEKYYYRLKLTEHTGKITFSNVVVISNGDDNKIICYPTVFTGSFFAVNNFDDVVTLTLCTSDGKIMSTSKLFPGMNEVTPVNTANGIFYYKITRNGKPVGAGKLVKQ